MTTIIPLIDEYLTSFLQGHKKSTIRRGHRNYSLGSCTLRSCSQEIPAKIENIRYCKLCDLSDSDALVDGFGSKDELLEVLFKIYTDLKFDDDMTIVEITTIQSHE
jgi:hypothetical protein